MSFFGFALVVVSIFVSFVLLVFAGVFVSIRSANTRLNRAYSRFSDLVTSLSSLLHSYNSVVCERYIGGQDKLDDSVISGLSDKDLSKKVEALASIEKTIKQGFLQAEKSPHSRYDKNFESLKEEFNVLFDKLQVTKKLYNDRSISFNHSVTTFPGNKLASFFKYVPKASIDFDFVQI